MLSSRMRSLSINVIKNSIQFSIGTAIYFLTFGSFFVYKFLFGLLGFLIAYSSVYQYNDLMDYDDDKKNKVKKYFKPLVSGSVERKHAESYSFLFMLVGLSICFSVDIFTGLMVSIILFLNFLHSSPFTRLKKTNFLLPNLFLVEFIKYSLGWFVMSSTLNEFPFLLITFLSSLYLIGYLYHKQKLKNFFSSKMKIMCTISFVLYVLCLFFFKFSLALLIPLPLSFGFFAIIKIRDRILKYRVSLTLTQIVGLCFVLSLFILMIPTVADANNDLKSKLDSVKENITGMIPQDIKTDINNTITRGIDNIKDGEILSIDSFFYRKFDLK